MNFRELVIRCEVDGKCAVKLDDGSNAHRFLNVTQALDFIDRLPGLEGTKVTVLDARGNVTFETLL